MRKLTSQSKGLKLSHTLKNEQCYTLKERPTKETKMAQPAKEFYSPAEYLSREEVAAYKSEYYDGEIFAMAGSSENHDFIAGNLYADLNVAFRGTACKAYTDNMKVQVEHNNKIFFTYPDAMVVCNERKFAVGRTDIITNPTVIIEVLSASTAKYDRTDKFKLYKSIVSLQQYVLIEQKRAYIEVFQRQPDKDWTLHTYDDISDTLRLVSVGFETPVANIYDGVEFPKRRKQTSTRHPRIIG